MPLTEVHGDTEIFFSFFKSGSIPQRGMLRIEISELGELNAKYDYDITYLSLLWGLNAKHSLLCGDVL